MNPASCSSRSLPRRPYTCRPAGSGPSPSPRAGRRATGFGSGSSRSRPPQREPGPGRRSRGGPWAPGTGGNARAPGSRSGLRRGSSPVPRPACRGGDLRARPIPEPRSSPGKTARQGPSDRTCAHRRTGPGRCCHPGRRRLRSSRGAWPGTRGPSSGGPGPAVSPRWRAGGWPFHLPGPGTSAAGPSPVAAGPSPVAARPPPCRSWR